MKFIKVTFKNSFPISKKYTHRHYTVHLFLFREIIADYSRK